MLGVRDCSSPHAPAIPVAAGMLLWSSTLTVYWISYSNCVLNIRHRMCSQVCCCGACLSVVIAASSSSSKAAFSFGVSPFYLSFHRCFLDTNCTNLLYVFHCRARRSLQTMWVTSVNSGFRHASTIVQMMGAGSTRHGQSQAGKQKKKESLRFSAFMTGASFRRQPGASQARGWCA